MQDRFIFLEEAIYFFFFSAADISVESQITEQSKSGKISFGGNLTFSVHIFGG